jgi:carboxypeptidase Taq
VRVPPELTGEVQRQSALGVAAWGPAKANADYPRSFRTCRRTSSSGTSTSSASSRGDETYDVLLDDYEPLMKTAEVRAIFDDLKLELVPLIREIADAGEVDSSFLHGAFDPATQREFSLQVLDRFGFTDDEWRLDPTAHPFMCSPGAHDVRLTTNFRPNDLTSIFATMHEFGHGIYEWGVAPDAAPDAARTAASHSPSTSHRAGRGRTSSAVRVRSGATSTRGSSRRSRSSRRSTRKRFTGQSTRCTRR